MAQRKRGLALTRLSVLTDESTSPERQTEHIDGKAQAKDIDIVARVEDLDVSATKVGPFERPDLGPWLTDPAKLDQYDVLIFWRLDRLIRNAIDFWDLIKWAKENGKGFISATEEIDLDSDWGQIIAMIIAKVAEIEARNISIRVTGAHATLRQSERWAGGHIPYGYMPKQLDKGWTLVRNPETLPNLLEAVHRVIDGESRYSIIGDFNDRGVLTPREWEAKHKGKAAGKEPVAKRMWANAVLNKMLRSKAMLGYAMHGGEPVLDEETGMPVQRYEPLIDLATWNRLQTALDEAASPASGPKGGTANLLGVLKCPECGRNMGKRTISKRNDSGKLYTYHYYGCHAAYNSQGKVCGYKKAIRSNDVESLAEDLFLALYGHEHVMKREYQRAEDHSGELKEATEALEMLLSRAPSPSAPKVVIQVFDKQIAALSAKLETLESMPTKAGGYVYVDTGETYAERWAKTEGWAERRQMLIDAGITAVAQLDGKKLSVRFAVPERTNAHRG
jgi:site-specific DNA recombinase